MNLRSPSSSCTPCTRLVVVLLAAVLTARSDGNAQTVRGRITVRGSNEPVPSAIASLVDSTGRVVATTLADDSGAYVLPAPASGRYAVRAERVGYRSTITAPREVVFGQVVEIPVTVSGEGVSLRGVKVTADRRCVVRPSEGLAAAQLWDEARKALNATTLTQMAQAAARQRRDPHRFTVRIRRFVRMLDPVTLAQRRAEAYEAEGESITPFVARDPAILARDGYVAGEADGGMSFYAPDAGVLLSDQFLDTHCFRVQTPARGRRDDFIGLAFEPVTRIARATTDAAHVDVRGVLWLDRATAELRYMDYRYDNLRLGVPTDNVGGQIEFRPLPDGRWIAWRWYIRTPWLERRRVDFDPTRASSGSWNVALGAIQEEGGEVLEVLPPGSRRIAVASITGVVYDSLRPGPMAGVRVFLSGTSFAATTGADGRYRIDSVPPGSYSASVISPRLDTLLLEAPVQRLTVSAGVESEADFAVPGATSLWGRWCPGTSTADTLGVVLGIVRDTSGLLASGVKVSAEWNTFDKPRSDRLAIRPLVAEGVSVAAGRYALCGLAAEVPIVLRASHGRTQHASAQVRLQRGEVRRIDLPLKLR